MELSKDLYIIKNNYFNGFIKNQLLLSISMKNSERLFFNKQIKLKDFLKLRELKLSQRNNISFKKFLRKKKKLQIRVKTLKKYYCKLFQYYYKIWNFKQHSLSKLNKYIKKNSFVMPQSVRYQLSRNFYSYQFFLYAQAENYKYKFNNKLYLKTFINKLQKNLIKSSPIYSFFKLFKRFAFNQKFLLFYYFESHLNTVRYFMKSRPFKRAINLIITRNELKTLKLLKFYQRKVKAKRTFKRR